MKRSTLMKLAFSLVAVLVFVSTYAQNPPSPYSLYDANKTVPTNVDYITLKSAGSTTMGYYALPDPLYHPNYVTAGTLTANFVWDWTIPTNPGAATVTYPVATFTANYARITYPATGNYVVNVAEHAPASMGGCVGANTVMNVTVVDAPTAAMTIAPGGSWQAITANQSYQICSAQATQLVTITFNEAVPTTYSAFSFGIAYKVELLDGTDAVTSTPTAEALVQDFPTGSKLKTGNVGTLTSATFTPGNPTSTFTFNTPALAIVSNSRTKYTYTLVRTGATFPAPATGFRSAISEKSDYIAGVAEYYPFTAASTSVSFIVNPAPVTGPIYHISNTYAY